jgi:Rad3-related DNA helicase
MTTTTAILSRALRPRDQQSRLAAFIDRATAPAFAAQADTGTGKTAVLLSAAVAQAKQGKRVILSTHTIQLLHQLERESSLFAAEGVGIGTRLGMRNFISPSRVRKAWARASARGVLAADDEAAFSDLVAFAQGGSGLIEDFANEYGELPAGLKPYEISLLPSARSADKAAWQRARASVHDSQIALQTHALTLAQSRFGRLPPVVIFDEADALGDVADSAEDKRLSLAELEATMKHGEIDTTPLDALLAAPKDMRLREKLADALAEAPKVNHDEEEVRFALSSARWILTAHKLDGPRRGTEVRREGNDTIIRSLWADRARWIWRNLTEAGVERAIFASATLAVGDRVALALRRYGVPSELVEGDSFSPRKFGKMSFRLIAETTPAPFSDGTANPAWQQAAADWLLREGLMRGASRPLVLAKSYADTAFFAERLGLTGHERGQPLSGYVEQFRTGTIRGLVTPAGWVGVDLPGSITDLVIPRLPYVGVDDLKAELVGRTDFPAIKAAMQRRLKQGLGRGIRTEDDRVMVWLADPRVHDMRNGIIAAIPERFRDQFLVALGQLRMTQAAVRTEQAAFRAALLAHYGKCVVTGCMVEAALEAAHLPGRSWKAGHNGVEDGIVVRADIHSLLDKGLMLIEGGVLRVDPSIAPEYGQYDGRRILAN